MAVDRIYSEKNRQSPDHNPRYFKTGLPNLRWDQDIRKQASTTWSREDAR